MRWQDLLAKLRGKPATPPNAPAETPPPPPEAPQEASPGVTPEPPAPPDPAPAAESPQPPDVAEGPEASDTPTPEPAPMEAAPAEPAPMVEPMQMSEPQADIKTPRGPRNTKTDAISRVYAQALLEMAEAKGTVDETADEVDQIEELLRAQPQLRRLLETPAIGVDQRRDLIDNVFKSRVSDTTWRFLQVVNAKHRAGALPGILAAFQLLLAEQRGIVEANVTVAQRLEPAEAEQVATRIGQALGKRVVLHQFVDEKLIGGMVIRIGDRVIDGSVASQLRSMRKQLIERGRDRAREI